MTNTPDKSETVEQRAREIYKRSPDLFYHSHNETRGHRHWGDLTEERREHFRDLARASSRPADQVPDMVERVARAHSPETWATIDELRSTAAWYREKIGKVGYRDGSAEREAESNQRLADKYANEQITRMRDALECARRDLNHLAAKYDEQEFVAPTICKIAALQAVPAASGEEPTEAMIEVGCEAMHGLRDAMRLREVSDHPETLPDYDEGDVCRAVFVAMRNAALKASGGTGE